MTDRNPMLMHVGGEPADPVPYCSHMACSKYNGQSGACSELNGHMPNVVCLPQIREDLREAELLRNAVFLGPLEGKTAHDRIVELEAEVDSYRDASTPAFNEIAKLCGAASWEYPGQVVRDVEAVVKQRDLYKESCDALEKGASDLRELVRHAEAVRDDARTFSARDLELRRAQARELDSMRDERDGAIRRELENRETHAQQRADLRDAMLFWKGQSELRERRLQELERRTPPATLAQLVEENERKKPCPEHARGCIHPAGHAGPHGNYAVELLSDPADRRRQLEWLVNPPDPEPTKAKYPPACRKCNDRGVIETGNNDLPCECPAGDHALFNTGGATKTGAQIKAER